MAAFAAGQSLALHVDIGFERSTICIVEEGMISKDSLQILNWGLTDVVDVLIFLVRATRSLDLNPYRAGLALELLLLKYADFELQFEDEATFSVTLFNFETRNWDKLVLFKSDLVLATNSIFEDALFLGKASRGFHRVVLEYLSRVPLEPRRRKLAISLVLSGALSYCPKMIYQFEDQLIRYIERFNYHLDEVMVVDTFKIRNITAFDLVWSGASVVSKLDSFEDTLISSHKYLGNQA